MNQSVNKKSIELSEQKINNQRAIESKIRINKIPLVFRSSIVIASIKLLTFNDFMVLINKLFVIPNLTNNLNLKIL